MKIISKKEKTVPFREIAPGETFRFAFAKTDSLYMRGISNESNSVIVKLQSGEIFLQSSLEQPVVPVSAVIEVD